MDNNFGKIDFKNYEEGQNYSKNSYEKGTKINFKSKIKYIIILSLILLISIIAIIFILFGDSNSQFELKIFCKKDVNIEDKNLEQSILFYEYESYRKVVQKLSSNISDFASDELMDAFAQSIKIQIDAQIEDMFGEDYEFVHSEMSKENGKVVLKIEYIVNKDNQIDMYSLLNYNIYSNSYIDIANVIEEGGLSCTIY